MLQDYRIWLCDFIYTVIFLIALGSVWGAFPLDRNNLEQNQRKLIKVPTFKH